MNTRVDRKQRGRVSQGQIYRDVEFIEYAITKRGNLEVSKIVFPLVIVLTQDCDLEQDSRIRRKNTEKKAEDKLILSVLVAPLYNAAHFYLGEHLSDLDYTMQTIKRGGTDGTNLQNNKNPRYHYLAFPQDIPITESVIDFKHYFSVNVRYLIKKRGDLVTRISPLYREDISQRFAAFLSRIGLPTILKK